MSCDHLSNTCPTLAFKYLQYLNNYYVIDLVEYKNRLISVNF